MKDLLKFITCGSVDDGKSTLIGHMLYDAKLLFADQKRALELESKVGSNEGKIDYSLLLDGLLAEREQGITIDVAYRYFTTENRSFIVADTPGHEEYTRNMAVGASFADAAVILVDASKGVLSQTRRHTRICSLMGIRDFIFAVNKMDLVDFEKDRFQEIRKDILRFTAEFEPASIRIIPVSATEGDNITRKSDKMLWYKEETLLFCLENLEPAEDDGKQGFSMPVQRVCRPDHTYRGFEGQIETGEIRNGEEITVLPSGEKARIKSILITDRKAESAGRGQAVTLELDREIDVSRGCVMVKEISHPVSSRFEASLLWMDDTSLVKGKNYFLRIGTRTIPATVTDIHYQVDVNTGEKLPAEKIFKNEIARCSIITSEKIVLEEFAKDRSLGGLILIDRITNMTSACGTVEHVIERENDLTWQKLDVTKEIRAKNLNQKPVTLWFTGLSGAGKSTLANALEKRLVAMGRHTMLLDGDNIRMGLNRDLGFKEQDRIENIRRIAEVAKLMNQAGLIVLTAFISPFERDRQSAREIIGEDYLEIYVSTPLEECEKRDVKGLYKKARNGEIPDFTGITSPYEVPEHADFVIDTTGQTLEESVEQIIKALEVF